MCTPVAWRRAGAPFALFALFALLSGCGSLNAAPPALPTVAPAPTVPEGVTDCKQVPGLAGVQSTDLYNLNFPDDAVATGTITSAPGAPMQVVAYVACLRINQSFGPSTPMGTAMDQVIATLGFFVRGWVFSKGFPTDGKTLSACAASQRCFMAGAQTYALLEQTRTNSSGLAVFDLRMALPQPPVPCDPILFPRYTYPASVTPYMAAAIPLPPGTRASLGQSSPQGITESFCSAGSASAVSAFMQAHLPQTGWRPVNINSLQLWKSELSGAPPLYMRLNPITDARDWSELEYYQGMNP